MVISKNVRTGVLMVHGGIALFLGLAFFYLSATMTNPLFEALAVVGAVMLATAALALAAITDWFAAFSAGVKSAHRLIFYLLAGMAFALAGLFIGYTPHVYMEWLVGFVALHALVFGTSAFTFVFTTEHHKLERRAMAAFGTVSILLSGGFTAWLPHLTDQTAIALLGVYLFFVGIKLLFFAWNSHRKAGLKRPPVLQQRPATS
jgi:MFS family permease